MSANKESEDFNQLRKLGFTFGGERSEFDNQPDSASTIGGIIGEQEYGIVSPEENDSEGILHTIEEVTGEEGELLPSDLSVVAPGGVSEWSSEHSLEEEKVIDERLRRKPNRGYFDL